MPKKDELNEKQRLFVIEYLKDFNATQAAIRAGYSKKTAHVTGTQYLAKPNIQAGISAQVDELLKQAKIPLEKQIFEFWMKRAFYDISEIINTKGEIKPEEELKAKGLMVCIDSINKKLNAKGETVMVYQFADKDKAVEMLQKYIQMIREQPITIKDDRQMVDLSHLLLGQKTDPKERERIIAELEKATNAQ